LVYEFLVEGGMTRFLAVYLAAEPEIIGPVRSARHYFLDTVLEWDGIYAHVGGSYIALDQIYRLGIADLDDTRGAGVFWLKKDRVRPYSTYTSIAKIREAAETQGYNKNEMPEQHWLFKSDDKRRQGDKVNQITVEYPGWLGRTVVYKYNAPLKTYFRLQDNKPHRDAKVGEQLRAANVIVQFVPMEPIPNDDKDRLDAIMVGEGRALLFSEGVLVEGTWSKSSRKDPTVYRDKSGEVFALRPGKTWILVVPLDAKVVGSE
jgi:hypothetical protein